MVTGVGLQLLNWKMIDARQLFGVVVHEAPKEDLLLSFYLLPPIARSLGGVENGGRSGQG